ncbi:MAG: hypothetical protein K0S55_1122 [Clostridia bacterium]|nr:hypothetical protein [Clostridia bacterium]
MIKKIIILCFALIFLLSGCSDIANNPVNNEGESKDSFIRDMNGYEFIFKAFHHVPNKPDLAPEVSETDRGDKMLKRYSDAEKDMNCTVKVEVHASDWSSDSGELSGNLAASIKFADLYDTTGIVIAANLEKLFRPYNHEENNVLKLDSGKWGTVAERAALTTPDGYVYGIRPSYWGVPYPAFKAMLFFNPRILQNANQPDPFALIEQKQWNWESFENILKGVTVTTDNDENDIYGLVSTTNCMFFYGAVRANGANPVYFDKTTNKFEYGLKDPNAIQALDWVHKLIYEDKTCEYVNDWWQKGSHGFVTGRYAFCAEYSWLGFMTGDDHYATEMEEPFGWLPFPVGPNGIYGNWGGDITDDVRFLGLPVTPDGEYEKALAIMEYIFEPLDGETKDTWKEDFKHNFFYEDNSFKYLMEMYENSVPDYSTLLNSALRSDKGVLGAYQRILANRETPAEAAEKIESFVNTELENLNNKYE